MRRSDDLLKTTSGDPVMTADQIGSLQPALLALLSRFRHCFKREVTFG